MTDDDAALAGEHEHEHGLAAFLVPARAARFRATIATPRGRAKIAARLPHHAADLDPRTATRLPDATGVGEIAELLRGMGAPARCYVLGGDAGIDGRMLDLREALEGVVSDDDAALISCIPATLGLFSDEAPGRQWLLRRPSR